jgi:hypothetical protein
MTQSFYGNSNTSSTSRLFYPTGRTEISMRDEMIDTLDGHGSEISKKQTGLIRVMRRTDGEKIRCACTEEVYSLEGDYHCPFCLGEGFYWDEVETEFYMWEPGYDTSLALRQEEGVEPGNVRVPLRIFYLRYSETLTSDDRMISLVLDDDGTPSVPLRRDAIWRIGTLTGYRLDTGRREFWRIVGWADIRKPLNYIMGS